MASPRKNTSPAKSARRSAPATKKPAPRTAPVAKKAAPKKPVKKAPAAPKKPVPKKPVPKKVAPKKPVAKPAPKPKARKLKAVARPPVTGANVHPLGVLPASARQRGAERGPLAPAAPVARPAAAPAKKPVRPRGPQRLTADELLELEEKLREERAKLMKEMGHLESTVLKVNPRDSAGDLSGYSFHMADAGTDAYERELGFQFASAEGRLLREFNEALRRLYAGEYGVCDSCGNAIAKARLLAIPTARLCRDCKEKEERGKPSQS